MQKKRAKQTKSVMCQMRERESITKSKVFTIICKALEDPAPSSLPPGPHLLPSPWLTLHPPLWLPGLEYNRHTPTWSLCSASNQGLTHLLLMSLRFLLKYHPLHETCLEHLHVNCNILHFGLLYPLSHSVFFPKPLSLCNILYDLLIFCVCCL